MRWTVGLMMSMAVCGCGTDEPTQAGKPEEPALLTRQDAEPAGEHCGLGGTAIRAGLDRNGNGQLDADEVEHTDYVCSAKPTVLFRQLPLAAGAQCPRGGSLVQTGVDDNGNGRLDDDEVDLTSVLCDSLELWDGDFTAQDWADSARVAALRGARVVTGSLEIVGDAPVELPALELVVGNLSAGGAVALPALRTIGGNASLGVSRSGEPALPMLEQIGGNASLGSGGEHPLAVPALARIGGALSVGGIGAHLVDAPVLGEVGGGLTVPFGTTGEVALTGLRKIGGDVRTVSDVAALRLDALESIGGQIHLDARLLPRLVLPALQTLGGDLWIRSTAITELAMARLTHIGGTVDLSDLTALTTVSLPAMFDIDGGISMFHDTALTTLDLGTLGFVEGSITIFAAPALTNLSVASLVAVGERDDHVSLQLTNTGLETLALRSLESLDGSLSVSGQPALREIQLGQLTRATAIGVGEAPVLDSLTAPKIKTLGQINFQDTGLHTVSFGQLTTISGALAIFNAPLQDLSGFPALRSVGLLDLTQLTRLRDLTGLTALHSLGSLRLQLNPALISLAGLENVSDLSGFLWLSGNQALTSVAALNLVGHIGNLVNLEGNPLLKELKLTRLRTIGGGLRIAFTALTSLDGVPNLRSVVGELDMTSNDGLSAEQVRAFQTQIGL